MMDKQELLLAINNALETAIVKLDNDNELWIDESQFPDNQKKIITAALNSFEKKVERYFIQQQKEVVTLIKAYIGKDDVLDSLVELISDFFFAKDERHITRLADLYEVFAEPVLSEIASIVCNEIVPDKEIESLTKRAAKWLTDHKIKFAKEVTQTTHDAVISTIKASKSIDDSIQALMELPEFDWRRARTTARTETIAAANAGTLEGWRQSEVVEGKEWCCAGGSRSRNSHKDADGQCVGLDEPFIVGGCKLMHPGDSSLGAGPEVVCNCRCTMLSIIKKSNGRR